MRHPPFALTALTIAATAAISLSPTPASPAPAPAPVLAEPDVPDVLRGDTWLRHHGDDLMPYWDMPEALGEPLGNFPSFRGRDGELLSDQTLRGVFTLARQVYGYSLAFHLTGEERYLTYARAGLDWIEAHGKDPVYGGFYGTLDADGDPVNAQGNKDLFDLASMGLAYGMYFNVTRDPWAEQQLLAVRDLIFEKYYDAATGRFLDSLTYDLTTEVDTGGNGGDIVNLLVPGTAVLLPYADLLSDPARRAQFTEDLRIVTANLVARHKNDSATNPDNRWMFWGRTARRGNFLAAQTDFGHNIKSYEMIYNANRRYADLPWDRVAADRTRMLGKAWDDPASRWSYRPLNFVGGVELDGAWWMHDEADQTLAAMDLDAGFVHADQLARSARTWLDIYVDHESPAREVFARVARDPALANLNKSFFGKNMMHVHEHALIMYVHGRAMEGLPATLHYAFPASDALTAPATPYWFDSARQFRRVGAALAVLPGHVTVEVDFSAITGHRLPIPGDDTTPPTAEATLSSIANAAGWHSSEVVVSVSAADEGVGVREIRATVTGTGGPRAWIEPGSSFALPALAPGEHDVTVWAVDALGNASSPHSIHLRVDTTAPTVSGLPPQPCRIWPPNDEMVRVADVVAVDDLSGLLGLVVTATSSEPGEDDVLVDGGRVDVRAQRDDEGPGRTYTITATATDVAGNTTVSGASCLVPHDLRR